jgi:hypothetical protein
MNRVADFIIFATKIDVQALSPSHPIPLSS